MEVSLEEYKENVRSHFEGLKLFDEAYEKLGQTEQQKLERYRDFASSQIKKAMDGYESGKLTKEAMKFAVDFWLDNYPTIDL